MNKRKALVYEATFRKRRKGIIYRMVVIEYDDGSGERFLVPLQEDKDAR